MSVDTTKRANCWSITWNNPPEDVSCPQPGWKLEGQFEVGESGTRHFQGMLKTPQVRFSAVKRVFPKAHIEIARNVAALSEYVHKEDTRVASYTQNDVPSIFQFSELVAEQFDENEFYNSILPIQDTYYPKLTKEKQGELLLAYIDDLVGRMIRQGQVAAEFIGINPMFRSAWKKHGWNIIERRRERIHKEQQQEIIHNEILS